MAPPSSAFALMGEAALGLAAKNPFSATLIDPRQTSAITFADSPLDAVDADALPAGPAPGAVLAECLVETSNDTAVNMFAAVPFGPGTGEYMAWVLNGDGLELAREMFAKHGVHNIPRAIIPPEASGWFRKEIKTMADLKGLKMRFFGLGAKVMAKMGVATQLLALK
jgi:TRAP-type mannitol/chloroaromatic compound transport system substrate-binding protein